MPVDYSIYLVTDRGILKGRDIFKAVEDAIKGGATLVQLREKDVSSLEFYNIAVKMKEVTRKYGVPLIINDRLDIALAMDADGLHVGQSDLPVEVARRLLGKGKILGCSANTIEKVRYGEKSGADYIGAGPVYPTGSKADADAPIGVSKLAELRKSISIPVVGIGGIGASNVREVKSSGIEGISLISAILGKEDVEAAARELAGLWR